MSPASFQQRFSEALADQQRHYSNKIVFEDAAMLSPDVLVITYHITTTVAHGAGEETTLHETRWAVYVDGKHVSSGTVSDSFEAEL